MPKSISAKSIDRIYSQSRKKQVKKPFKKQPESKPEIIPPQKKPPQELKQITFKELIRLPTNTRICYSLTSTYLDKKTGLTKNIKCRSAFFKYVKFYFDKANKPRNAVIVRVNKRHYTIYEHNLKIIGQYTDLRTKSLVHDNFDAKKIVARKSKSLQH